MDAFAAGDLPRARSGFVAVLAADSTDADARAMRARTEQAIARQAAGLMEQAARYLRAGLASEAAPLIDQHPSIPGRVVDFHGQ